jgi:hypothetical protein
VSAGQPISILFMFLRGVQIRSDVMADALYFFQAIEATRENFNPTAIRLAE